MFKIITVPAGHRALKIRDGRLIEILGPGRYHWIDPGGRTKVQDVILAEGRFASHWARVIETDHPELMEAHFVRVQPVPGTLALVTRRTTPVEIVKPGETALFWKGMGEINVDTIDLDAGLGVDRRTADLWAGIARGLIFERVVERHEAAYLVVDGALIERLAPGRHAFWAVHNHVAITGFDLREQILEVAAQEILTKDRVAVRLTLTAVFAITNAETLMDATRDLEAILYRAVQVAIREAVGGRTLDVLLRDRMAVDKAVAEAVIDAAKAIGVSVRDVRVKDVILPGEMRDILTKVVEAEKVAEANVIRRREETAATRALLNTAKLMDDNPTLMRLKELETVERLTEKIGVFELHQTTTGTGLTALVDSVLGKSKPAA